MNLKVKRFFTPVIFTSILLVSACSEQAPEAPKQLATPPAALQPVVPKPPVVISAEAQKYEGKIVRQPPANRGKDDGWYLVKNGKRQWIVDGSWLEKNGYKANAVIEISTTEFSAIPEDPMPVN
ncbi:MAG: hypothetical protein IPN53_07810 [Comamonadaceae bacterium]|nr:hypothetical protein [Comamonadaceae bacterium]